jgi:Rrf2 family iron-sulfur cluster assembly transcriptional regulator
MPLNLLRILRRSGFITSARGKAGGYTLSRPAGQIVIGVLGGRLFESQEFCHEHSGQIQVCTRSVDCSVRSLWHAVQSAVDEVLSKTTLQDLLRSRARDEFVGEDHPQQQPAHVSAVIR